MTRVGVALFLALLPVSAADLATITVSVVEEGTLLPIRGAKVTLLKIGADRSASPEGVTDVNGTYRFAITTAGDYIPRASVEGYVERSLLARNGTFFQIAETASKEPPVHRITFSFYKQASIAGRVLDEDIDKPIQGLKVTAVEAAYRRGKRVFRPGTPATTDANGAFRIDKLPPGEYFLKIEGADLEEIRAVWQPDYGEEFRPVERYGRRYWPDNGFAPDTGIRLRSGEAFDAGKQKIAKAVLGRVRGRIPSAICAPGERFQLSVTGRPLDYSLRPVKALLACGSEFTVQNLPPGDYAVEAWRDGVALKDGVFGGEELNVPAHGDIRLGLPFSRAVAITGKVVCDCRKADDRSERTLRLWRVQDDDFPRAEVLTIREDGTFETWVVAPVRSQLALSVSSNQTFLKSNLYNEREVGRYFDLDPNATVHSLAITLSDQAAGLTGSVSASGSPIATHVVLAPWPLQLENGYPDYTEVSSDSGGKFRFAHVPGGTYRIVAIGVLAWETRERPDVLANWIAAGEAIDIEENHARAVTLECKIL